LRKMKKQTLDPDVIISYVSEYTGISRKNLLSPHHNGIARGIVSELLYRFSAFKLHEIGRLLGIDYSSVYKCRYRLKAEMSKKKKIAGIYNLIENKIKTHLSNV
jgi:chromosomal replication initiation ATPase DnaA